MIGSCRRATSPSVNEDRETRPLTVRRRSGLTTSFQRRYRQRARRGGIVLSTESFISSRPTAARDRNFIPIACIRLPAARDRSRNRVRTAPPAAWMRRPVAAIRPTAVASNPASDGSATSAGTTVVSARYRLVRNNFDSAAFASSVSLSPLYCGRSAVESNNASTRANSSGNRRNSSGSTDSHNEH